MSVPIVIVEFCGHAKEWQRPQFTDRWNGGEPGGGDRRSRGVTTHALVAKGRGGRERNTDLLPLRLPSALHDAGHCREGAL